MRLGIDFGTTRTVVAAVDRGNYPVVTFADNSDEMHDWFPSVVAARGNELVFGFDALDAAQDGYPVLRSIKRTLAAADLGPETTVRIGGRHASDAVVVPIMRVVVGFLVALRHALEHASSLSDRIAAEGVAAVVVAVPAHALGTQRFHTLEAFREAGFPVEGMVNEPSAAGFEYTHRRAGTRGSKRRRIVVYDLGGGTFDASLVAIDGVAHEVLATVGDNRLGGEDVDDIIFNLALDAAGRDVADLTFSERIELRDQCRDVKERLSPQTRRIVVEVAGVPVTIPVPELNLAVRPLIERTLAAMAPLISGLDGGHPNMAEISGVYLVGGATGLPLVPRMLREQFGRRVQRSPLPSSSTAVGLALAVDPQSGYSLTDRLSRGIGVFREADHGRATVFDELLHPDLVIDSSRDMTVRRRYRPVHDLGVFRFVEYTSVDHEGEPRGDIAPLATIRFPFDQSLQQLDEVALARHPVRRLDHESPNDIEETYTVDATGLVTVEITDTATGHSVRRGWGVTDPAGPMGAR